ncbi:MAG: hypothetical protein M1837_007310 [Sclerophora amabilis]|nr:MAG: hypothetical protein M1837_007310 [Sclerophora amabilis]
MASANQPAPEVERELRIVKYREEEYSSGSSSSSSSDSDQRHSTSTSRSTKKSARDSRRSQSSYGQDGGLFVLRRSGQSTEKGARGPNNNRQLADWRVREADDLRWKKEVEHAKRHETCIHVATGPDGRRRREFVRKKPHPQDQNKDRERHDLKPSSYSRHAIRKDSRSHTSSGLRGLFCFSSA